ncbi:MAG: hypothetical protein HKL96_04315 [Phycisphaerales bacterium]|nr:hypothetical protein [Phycisphaerales bacterium]
MQVPKETAVSEKMGRPAAPAGSGVAARPSSPDADIGLSRNRSSSSGMRRPVDPTGSGAFAGSPVRSVSPLSGMAASSVSSRLNEQDEITPSAYIDRPGRRTKTNSKSNLSIFYALIALGVLFIATIVIIAVVVLRGGNSNTSSAAAHQNLIAHAAGGGTAVQGPAFLAIPLSGSHIVFSLDSSSANTDSFGYVAEAVANAVKSLGAQQHFRIALWTESGLQTIPSHGWLTKADAAADLQKLMNANVYGSSSATKCMLNSLHLGGDQIIFVTAKVLLPSDLAEKVLQARTHAERLDAVTVDGAKTQLQKLAKAAGGIFKSVSNSDIRHLSGQQQ